MKFIVAVLFSFLAFNSFAACELGDDKKCESKAECDSLKGIFKEDVKKCFKQAEHATLEDCKIANDGNRDVKSGDSAAGKPADGAEAGKK